MNLPKWKSLPVSYQVGLYLLAVVGSFVIDYLAFERENDAVGTKADNGSKAKSRRRTRKNRSRKQPL